LAQLLALLEKRALHFSRADSFHDPFEGTRPRLEVECEQEILGVSMERSKWTRKCVAMSCWHLGEHESEAMWKLYAGDGIAIQSSFGRLTGSLPRGQEKDGSRPIYVGRVTYIDFETDISRPIITAEGRRVTSNLYTPFTHKRLSFSHEQEVRAVVMVVGELEEVENGEMPSAGVPSGGFDIPVELDKLVERALVSPTTPEWFQEVVMSAVKRYGAAFPIEKSALAAVPYE
jgi:hypothetical protein